MTYDQAFREYGTDKPDLRYDMKLYEINHILQGYGFESFDKSLLILSIKLENVCLKNGLYSTKKKIEELIINENIELNNVVWMKIVNGKYTSSANKYFNQNILISWSNYLNSQNGDLLLAICGSNKKKIRNQMGCLRSKLGSKLGLRDSYQGFIALWITDFPLFEYDQKENKLVPMHHIFTNYKSNTETINTNPKEIKAISYDMVINGVEVGGGSIRIHNYKLQLKMFELLGFKPEQTYKQFGFLLDALSYGAPPHGGIAFGLDRLCQILGNGLGFNSDSIRDYIAFPKNSQGNDIMINSPSEINDIQMNELKLTYLNSI